MDWWSFGAGVLSILVVEGIVLFVGVLRMGSLGRR